MVVDNFHPSKKMGQNFLTNPHIANQILDFVDFNKYDCAIEIGPGQGALTKPLIKRTNKVVAIELDKRLCEYIANTLPLVNLINDDILNVDFNKLFSKFKNPILISNLPYSISSPLLFKYINLNKSVDFVCMLQKEFVDRMVAAPSSKQYGALSVVVQTYLQIQTLMLIDRANFNPKPKIDSVVLKITKLKKSVDQQFVVFVKKCFMAKRKTLINNLKPHFNLNKLNTTFSDLQINSQIRAEALTKEVLEKLFQKLNYEN